MYIQTIFYSTISGWGGRDGTGNFFFLVFSRRGARLLLWAFFHWTFLKPTFGHMYIVLWWVGGKWYITFCILWSFCFFVVLLTHELQMQCMQKDGRAQDNQMHWWVTPLINNFAKLGYTIDQQFCKTKVVSRLLGPWSTLGVVIWQKLSLICSCNTQLKY